MFATDSQKYMYGYSLETQWDDKRQFSLIKSGFVWYSFSNTQIKNGNGAVTARLQWDPAFGARHTQSFLRTQAFIDSEVLRLMSPYTPIQTSMLIKSATLGTVIGSGKINQIAPYAAWQYYRTDTTRKYDPRRGAYWFERMKADHRTYILKGAAEKAGAKYNE